MNKYKKAIQTLKTSKIKFHVYKEQTEEMEAPTIFDFYHREIYVLEKLVEKSIPKKPVYKAFDDNGNDEIIPTEAYCPTCGYEFEFGYWNDMDNHHCVCGQVIDWER